MGEFTINKNNLCCCFENEFVELTPWGPNGIRVRCTQSNQIKMDGISALINQGVFQSNILVHPSGASIQNGELKVTINSTGVFTFINVTNDQVLLQEKPIHEITLPARAYKELMGGLFHIECCFESYDGEHFYGLGQHQHGRLDQKGCVIDLIQRNTEVTVPFLLSSRGYGFLWNNPAIGRVELGTNATRWVAEATPQIDYWITTGNNPSEILSNYADVTGHASELPEWSTGFWQSKLRYASQAELESVVNEYKRRDLPISVIVIDFFHWTRQGDWQFDPKFWPDPTGMVNRLEALGVKVMVSVWPTVNRLSKNFNEMIRKQLIIRNKMGSAAQMFFVDIGAENGTYVHYYDSTHPEAKKFIWKQVKQGYFKHGIKTFWLDACEPEMLPFMPENLKFYAGDGESVANIYPLEHVRGFYEGMLAEGETTPLFLCRSAWAGSQRYGAVVWSGDIKSTFPVLRAQVRAGLNMGLSGIPWWTSDIGGFRGGDPSALDFQELIVRWFQFGTFCPIFRLHGHRLPNIDDFSGGPNEVWSFGEPTYQIIKKFMMLRERLRPYIQEQMLITSKTGVPLMRPLFVDFPSDQVCYQIEDQYMFGSDILVAPITEAGCKIKKVYLPAGNTWKDAWTNKDFEGGQWASIDSPIDTIPLFLKDKACLPINE